MMGGIEATKLVKQYFLDNHGPAGVVGFRVEAVEHGTGEAEDWTVHCSFFENIYKSERTHYDVVVRGDGEIDSVRMIAPGDTPAA